MPGASRVRSPRPRPLHVTLVAERAHTLYGERRRVGTRYRLPLRLAGVVLERGDARLDAPAAPGAHDWWGAPGRVLQAEPDAATVAATAPTAGALRVLQGCGYDPGNAAYRFHSALNECTPHASAFLRWHDTNPTSSLRQLDLHRDWPAARAAALEADVLHCHVDYGLLTQLGFAANGAPRRPRDGQVIVRHYHGSRPDGRSHVREGAADDARLDALVVGARLTLVAEDPTRRLQWLPIAVPVARYRAMREAARLRRPSEAPFRVAHSPTARAIKGTAAFLRVCARLRAAGVPIEPVLIEGRSHAEALAMKAACDAVFDAFWLGLQGSGLEGGAMRLPVVAGDADVRARYEAELGTCPYTFVPDEAALGAVLEQLATDPAFAAAEAARVADYVARVHDYPAVAARYVALLDAHAHRAGGPATDAPGGRRACA